MSNEYERHSQQRETGNGMMLAILFVLAMVVGALFWLIFK